MNDLPWQEKIKTFESNPHSANIYDISRMARELRDAKAKNQRLKEQLKDMLVFNEPPTQVEWEIMRLEMKKLTTESEE